MIVKEKEKIICDRCGAEIEKPWKRMWSITECVLGEDVFTDYDENETLKEFRNQIYKANGGAETPKALRLDIVVKKIATDREQTFDLCPRCAKVFRRGLDTFLKSNSQEDTDDG